MRMDDAGAAGPAGRDAVEWYFGDLVEEVARESSISRTDLVDALARLEAVTSRSDAGAVVRHRGPDESVVALAPDQWGKLSSAAGLSAPETTAVRCVHARMAGALGEPSDERVPLVLLTAIDGGVNEMLSID